MRKILEYEFKCPMCRSMSKCSEYIYNIPIVGEVILTSCKCYECGFKHIDVRLIEVGEPRKVLLKVTELEDLNSIVIRSSTASIVIPELGVEVTPGPASMGYITTVEGIVLDALDKTKFICESTHPTPSGCSQRIELMEKASRGELPITLILIDPEGVSTIVNKKTVFEHLKTD
ncbi:MAG: ZPR1 zinc finger domain-containing protein [Desulfurococcaceae archaeon]|nr:ZPR1 zinc finger domain-containing protein [Sulfolobales archaeon]MDW8170205.1 ZPR1 zinc finger domain-containing protein [Desulfurococcaceae archaeon]